MILTADYHTHTVYSHGTGTPESNVLAAIEKGLKCIAISEHGPGSIFYGIRNKHINRLRREIDELNRRFCNDIQVLMGLECNLTGFGCCDLPFDTSPYDLLLLGYHRGIVPKDKFARTALLSAFKLSKYETEKNTDAMLEALNKYPIDIVAHPGEYIPVNILRLAQGAKELGVLLELNSKHTCFDVNSLKQAAEAGVFFVISSDAHDPKDVGAADILIKLAKEAQVIDKVINIEGFCADPKLRLLNRFSASSGSSS